MPLLPLISMRRVWRRLRGREGEYGKGKEHLGHRCEPGGGRRVSRTLGGKQKEKTLHSTQQKKLASPSFSHAIARALLRSASRRSWKRAHAPFRCLQKRRQGQKWGLVSFLSSQQSIVFGIIIAPVDLLVFFLPLAVSCSSPSDDETSSALSPRPRATDSSSSNSSSNSSSRPAEPLVDTDALVPVLMLAVPGAHQQSAGQLLR